MKALLRQLIPPETEFRRQIMILVSVGILVLALVSSLITAWVNSENERDQLVRQSLQLTEGFAEQSVLAMLFESAENAQDSAAATLSFPNVVHVLLRKPDGGVLLDKGGMFDGEFDSDEIRHEAMEELMHSNSPGDNAQLIHETSDYLYFCAPILERRPDSHAGIFVGSDDMSNRIGYAHVMVSKAALKAHRITTIVQNSAVSLALAVLMLLVLQKVISRITTPLSELSTLMREQDAETETSRVAVKGPIEIQDMARAFNAMMDVLDKRDLRLRNQNDTLENQVRARTRQLIDARDAAILASKHKSAFLANMSHELRTPMNAVLGYTSMVIEDMRAGTFHIEGCLDDLSRVDNAGKHLLSMINNILDLAKIEAGRMELELDTVDIRQLVRQVEDTVLPMITERNNKIELDVTTDDSTLVMDPVKLRQILVNLLSNATKFTEDGVITIKVEHNQDALHCAVIDNGVGMDDEQQQRIFRAFKQADMTTTKNFGGTGLGLTISQRLCTLMGGTIRVISAPGKGSCFYFTIPLPVQEHQEDEDTPVSYSI